MPAVKADPRASVRVVMVSFMGALPTRRIGRCRAAVAAGIPAPLPPAWPSDHVATSPASTATGSREDTPGAVPRALRGAREDGPRRAVREAGVREASANDARRRYAADDEAGGHDCP